MLVIRPFTFQDSDEALAARTELDADDFDFLLGYSSRRGFDEYLEQLAAHEQGLGLPPGWVKSALWGAFVDGELVGRTCIRFELNDHLRSVGGHVGYAVRPQHRRRGYATQILRQSLHVLAQRGIESALVTCRVDNIASAGTIEANGGVLE
ncbi:MAG: GNAT family N-acetyltransferase, partial [Paeniglutamicibacter terrestris]